jgi:hypothetical protein
MDLPVMNDWPIDTTSFLLVSYKTTHKTSHVTLNMLNIENETIPMEIAFQTPRKIIKDAPRIIPGPSIRDRIIALNLAHRRHKNHAPPEGGICMLPTGGFKWKRPPKQPKTGMMRRLRMYKQQQHIGPRHAMNPANNGGQNPANERLVLPWNRRVC